MSERRHIPCPSCSSSDAYSIQENGWGKCFSCGVRTPPENGGKKKRNKEVYIKKPVTPIGDVFNVPADRGISRATAEKYKIWMEGDYVFFPNFVGDNHVGNKKRNIHDKNKQWHEGSDDCDLFGAHLFPPGGKAITVTEGEYDAMAGFELLGSKYPVVSVVNGTGSALRDAKRNYEYLNSFDKIVLSFDADEPGRKAAKEVAALFAPGKVCIVPHKRHKDANEYLLARDHGPYTKEWWQATPYMPDGLKLGTTIWEEIINRPNHFTVPYPFEGLNFMTYGIRLSEFVVLTAETGRGKTTLLKEIEYALLQNPEVKEKGYGIGFMHLEEPNYDTALGLLSVHNNKPYHLPDTERTIDELRSAYDAVINTERVVIWDHFGSNAVEAILDKVRHMHALGCKYIVLDHLSIIVSDQSGDERKQLDEISTKLKMLCMELNIALIAVIHQNRQGQIRGTAGVEQLANMVIKISREHEDPDPWRRNVTKVLVQKNRFCGRTGPACYLWYNEMTGRLTELDEEEIQRYESGGTIRDDERPF